MKIPLIKSTFYREKDTKEALCNFITKAQKLSMGTYCEEFEEKFSRWQKRSYCVLFNSGSSANLALIQSLRNMGKIKENANIGFSALTWATNVMPLLQMSLKTTPIDVKIDTLNISFEKIQEVHGKTPLDCLFLTNLLGFSDDIDKIKLYCAEQNILLLEDNCESLGSEYKKIKLGNFGYGSTFSFFVGHHLSTIEGGAVCTDDKELYSMLLMVRSHGWDRNLDTVEKQKLRTQYDISDFDSKYAFYDLAYNIRPTEIQGFLGVTQLNYLDEMISKREDNYRKLTEIFNNKNIQQIYTDNMTRISNFAMPIICGNAVSKSNLLKRCDQAQIETRPIVGGLLPSQPFYKKYVKHIPHLPNASFVHKHGFYIGNNPELTELELDTMINTLLKDD